MSGLRCCSRRTRFGVDVANAGLARDTGELGDRVVASPAARTAARESPQRKPAARQRTVPLDRLVGVVRAGRLISAGSWQNAREGRLIASYQSEEEPFHGRVLCFAEFRSTAALIAADNCVTDA